MKDPGKLPRAGLNRCLRDIQSLMYRTEDGIDPDKQWTPETLELIAEVLARHGLVPERFYGYDELES
jgi:hypothetical protein